MGAAVLDVNNDGLQDWFVSSILDSNSAQLDGHRLYVNKEGVGTFTATRIDPKENEWSWASCAADFDNDGYQDIFYVSGFGEALSTASFETDFQETVVKGYLKGFDSFSRPKPKLLLNNQQGGLKDVSLAVGLSEVQVGRGIGCFDYQRDGDIDVLILPLEGKPVIYKK